MKVGIFTINTCHNYGAMLQAYATQHALDMLGYKSEIVYVYSRDAELKDKRSCMRASSLKSFLQNLIINLFMSAARQKIKRFNDFHETHLQLSRRFFSADEFEQQSPAYDIYLVGSDQTWNLEHGFEGRKLFFLDFIKHTKCKMSYGASFGTDSIHDKYKAQLKTCLSSFKAISVREQEGVHILNELGLRATQVMDPTFLVSPSEWSQMAGDTPLISGDYVFAYGFGDKDEAEALIIQARQQLNLPIIGTSISYFSPFSYDKFYQQAGPIEFLNLIKFSKYVITASYHGAAFAIHFRKDFYVVRHKTRNSRMQSMLSSIGLDSRCISPTEALLDFAAIDYTEAAPLIEERSGSSLKWLQEQLQNIRTNEQTS